jgi:three-Cys-motif partner protein
MLAASGRLSDMAKRPRSLEFDEIGYWSEVKLAILDEYAKPYNEILKAKKLKTVYVDAFAGAGHHISKGSGGLVKGSPVRALEVKPPFDYLHFVDLDNSRTDELRRLSQNHSNVTVHSGDANVVLLDQVFPMIRYEQYRRGLCILDPYGLHLDWSVIKAAGASGTIEIFLNFPVMDMNMNVLWHDPDRVDAIQRERMTRFWGDESWLDAAYSGAGNLFGHPEKQTNEDVAEAFGKRLKAVAGFKHVPNPIPMRNTTGATVYYLFFAAHQRVAASILTSIFEKYRNVGNSDV